MFAFSGISLTGRLWAISASHASNKAIVQDFSGLYPLGLSETSQIFLWNAPTEQRQKPLTFHYQTGWLIGISYFMAYYTVTPLYLGSFFFIPYIKQPYQATIPYHTNNTNQPTNLTSVYFEIHKTQRFDGFFPRKKSIRSFGSTPRTYTTCRQVTGIEKENPKNILGSAGPSLVGNRFKKGSLRVPQLTVVFFTIRFFSWPK